MLVDHAFSASKSVGIVTAIGNIIKLTIETKEGQQICSSVMHIDDIALSLAMCSTGGEDFCIVMGTSSSMFYCHAVGGVMGVIRQISARKVACTALALLSMVPSERFICSNEEGIYVSGPASKSDEISLSKSKLAINSEIGPQNRLLLYKERLTVVWLFQAVEASPDVIIVSKNPVSAMFSIHWGAIDITNNAITLHWSMSIPTQCPVLPSSTARVMSTSPPAAVWTCIAIGKEVWILSAKGLLGKVDLVQYPRVCAVAIRSSSYMDNICCTRGTVVLSCVGGTVFELVVEVTDTACVAQSITEKHMHTIYNQQSRQLPSCEGIIMLPWLSSAAGTSGGPVPLVLYCYSAQFGCEVLVDAEVKESLREDQVLWNGLHALHSVAGITSAVQLKGQQMLAKHYCAVTDQSALSTLSTSSVRLRCTHMHPLQLDALTDLRVLSTVVSRSDEPIQLLALTSKSAEQSAFFWQQKDQLAPCENGSFTSDDVTVGVFAVDNLVVQVTSNSVAVVVVGGTSETQTSTVERVDSLVRRTTGAAGRLLQLDMHGTLKPGGTASTPTSDFRHIQFACMMGASLFLGSERVLLQLSVTTDKTLPAEQSFVLPAAVRCVAGCMSNAASNVKGTGIIALAYWDIGVVHVLHVTNGTIDTQCPAMCIVAHEAAGESVRMLGVCPLPNSEATATYAVLTVTSQDLVVITHVAQSAQGSAWDSTTAKDTLITGTILAVQAVPSGFILSASEAQYLVVCEQTDITCAWTCSQIQSPSRQKIQSVSTMPGESSSMELCWMESAGADDSSASLCFGEILQGVNSALLEELVHIAGRIISLDVSIDATRLVVLSDHSGAEKDLVLGCTAVEEGEVAVYDIKSMQCVWRQALASDEFDAMRLIGALAGPLPVVRYGAPAVPTSLCVSLLQASAAAPGAPYSSLILTVLTVPADSLSSSAQCAPVPLGSVEIAWDASSAESPTPNNSSEAAPSLVTPVLPAVHFASLADDITVLCLPGNTLCLVGWAQQIAAEETGSLQLVELSRLTLLEKVASVVEMAVVKNSRVVLSLALCGLEIYSLHRRGDSGPQLQISYVVSDPSAIWSELALCECIEDSGDAQLTAVAHNRVSGEAQRMSVCLYGDYSMLTGKTPSCTVKSLDIPHGVLIDNVAQVLPVASTQAFPTMLLLTNGDIVRHK